MRDELVGLLREVPAYPAAAFLLPAQRFPLHCCQHRVPLSVPEASDIKLVPEKCAAQLIMIACDVASQSSVGFVA